MNAVKASLVVVLSAAFAAGGSVCAGCRRRERTQPDGDKPPAGTRPAEGTTRPANASTRPALSASGYSAEGVLMRSVLFAGGPNGPKRYTVRDPNTRLISAYVQCSSGVVDLERHAGMAVRVTGTETYDQDLRIYILEAERVEKIWEPVKTDQPAPSAVPPLPPATRAAPTGG